MATFEVEMLAGMEGNSQRSFCQVKKTCACLALQLMSVHTCKAAIEKSHWRNEAVSRQTHLSRQTHFAEGTADQAYSTGPQPSQNKQALPGTSSRWG